ncbi:DNA primase [Patescibacteria group bacterium]|nr:DNA primase [Patescibacteria group bacterium]MBU0776674.1 DNA primase [Patescibacteria group bacterium]MBU0846006.1 DNA primase [Patescibacteria group bacterium]MBU0922494.1 DNA primase [Patescibacteria group bacterium]MBU1066773.1 DNA primase [Patescibacteria group bacterium]
MPQDQIEEVKTKTDIVPIISEHVELKKAGRNYKGLCPFHSEKTPSFMVSPELQIFKCFGCGESGDVISFLQKYEGMDFPEALKYLADRAGVKLIQRQFKGKGEKEKLIEINALAAKFYNYILLNHKVGKPALDYLIKERGLKLETIKAFNIGFSPNVPLALKKFLIDKKKFSYQDLEKAGIVYRRGGGAIDRFKGRIIFPLLDHRGNNIGLAGRILPSIKTEAGKYINSPETEIYHKSKVLYGLNSTRRDIKKENSVVVVEGELDMISSWQSGVKNTVAIKGTALTEDQVKLLSRFGNEFILALDSDAAGDKAARRSITLAQDQGVEVKVARLGKYKDPDEMARKAPGEYKKALKKAQGVWDFLVDLIFSKYDETSGTGKAKISKEISPILAEISDEIVQAHYIEKVARKLGVPRDAVADQTRKTKTAAATGTPKIAIPTKPKVISRRELLEERLLALAFQSDPKILSEKKTFSLFAAPLTTRIAEEYKKYSAGNKEFNPSDFAASLPKELVQGFADMILEDVQNLIERPQVLKKEQEMVIRELGLLKIKDELSALGEKISEYEEKGEKAKLRKAEEKFGELSERLTQLEESESKSIIL